MAEKLLTKLVGLLSPGRYRTRFHIVTIAERLNYEASAFVLWNTGNTNIVLQNRATLIPGARLPIGSADDKSIQVLDFEMKFDETGVGSPRNELTIMKNLQIDC